jgi:hypothetical protein
MQKPASCLNNCTLIALYLSRILPHYAVSLALHASTGPANTSAAQQHGDAASCTFTVSPAAPPLTDSQRTRASKALARSLQLQQQRKLSFSPQLELLVVQPLSVYQQYAQGVGAFANTRVGTCQTGQLDQDLHEQDAQTEEVCMLE